MRQRGGEARAHREVTQRFNALFHQGIHAFVKAKKVARYTQASPSQSSLV